MVFVKTKKGWEVQDSNLAPPKQPARELARTTRLGGDCCLDGSPDPLKYTWTCVAHLDMVRHA
jgi:hypothetical protein